MPTHRRNTSAPPSLSTISSTRVAIVDVVPPAFKHPETVPTASSTSSSATAKDSQPTVDHCLSSSGGATHSDARRMSSPPSLNSLMPDHAFATGDKSIERRESQTFKQMLGSLFKQRNSHEVARKGVAPVGVGFLDSAFEGDDDSDCFANEMQQTRAAVEAT